MSTHDKRSKKLPWWEKVPPMRRCHKCGGERFDNEGDLTYVCRTCGARVDVAGNDKQ